MPLLLLGGHQRLPPAAPRVDVSNLCRKLPDDDDPAPLSALRVQTLPRSGQACRTDIVTGMTNRLPELQTTPDDQIVLVYFESADRLDALLQPGSPSLTDPPAGLRFRKTLLTYLMAALSVTADRAALLDPVQGNKIRSVESLTGDAPVIRSLRAITLPDSPEGKDATLRDPLDNDALNALQRGAAARVNAAIERLIDEAGDPEDDPTIIMLRGFVALPLLPGTPAS